MFLKDHIPILIDLPKTLDYADIYFIHDVHYGSELFDDRKWEALKKQILADDKAYVCWVGDIMENAIFRNYPQLRQVFGQMKIQSITLTE